MDDWTGNGKESDRSAILEMSRYILKSPVKGEAIGSWMTHPLQLSQQMSQKECRLETLVLPSFCLLVSSRCLPLKQTTASQTGLGREACYASPMLLVGWCSTLVKEMVGQVRKE